jgi:hypothetical protein
MLTCGSVLAARRGCGIIARQTPPLMGAYTRRPRSEFHAKRNGPTERPDDGLGLSRPRAYGDRTYRDPDLWRIGELV